MIVALLFYLKKAEETGDTTKTETTTDPTDDVVDQKEYVAKSEAAEKLKKAKIFTQ